MAAGIIDHETGTRDMRALRGLWRSMPITATLAIVAAAAMAGVPLLNGFLSKEMFFAETCTGVSGPVSSAPRCRSWRRWRARSRSPTRVRFIHGVFFNGRADGICRARRTNRRGCMRCRWRSLVLVCVVVGMLPGGDDRPAARRRAPRPRRRRTPAYSLALWHGFNLPLLMSALALVAGVVAVLRCCSAAAACTTFELLPALSAKLAFDAARARRGAALRGRAFRALPYHRLRGMSRFVFVAAIVAAAWPLRARRRRSPHRRHRPAGAACGRLRAWSASGSWVVGVAACARGRRAVSAATRGADPGRRGRPGRKPHVRAAVGTRPRADAAAGRDRSRSS